MVGGASSVQAADDEIKQLISKIAFNIQNHTGKVFNYLNAVSFRKQVVAGTLYFVKVDCGDEHIHVKVFQSLDGELAVRDVQRGHSSDSDLTTF